MPALDIANLRFRYAAASNGAGESWNVNIAQLRLDRGEQMLLTGTSGRGKSTLLHLVAGLIDPHEGEISIDGQSLRSLHGAKRDLFRGSRIGMIFQTFNLLHGFSAQENVMAALMFSDAKRFPHATHRERAQRLLAHLGIDRPNANPDQLSVG